ncbi:MAG: nucleotidyltransferase domain-containing protein [Deltaproteobacteria bacterium]|nr:nucleotidyltransferase domain-containing protein [Deltaproteobacteria bacterium]MBF0523529.1 nucleotidyltransferase domain-containing protein [Deltaproteobacteria bacterium]
MPKDYRLSLGDIVQCIVKRFGPEKIILFGSAARGTATFDSDIDLMVVMPVEGSLRQKANEIDLALADRSIPLDLVVVTPEQYERQKRLFGTIVRQAEREGKVVYERAA